MPCWTPSAPTPTRCRRRSAIRPSARSCSSAPDEWLLELFHGPTLAFKDVALQLVGRLFDHVLAERGERVTIVGATTGDTGTAAIDAWPGATNVDIVILHPEGRVSEVQRRQMTTVDAPNVHAVAVEGTFDDCQDLVKAMFTDAAFRDQHRLSAVNSINWARVMAQIVYYVDGRGDVRRAAGVVRRADRQLRQRPRGLDRPTMGAPIDRLLIGSNRNDILTRFVDDADHGDRGGRPTLSPSMDIQVSSNFERLLFELNGRDGGMTAEQLRRFRATGHAGDRGRPARRVSGAVFRAARFDDADDAGHHARPCTPRPGCWSTRTRRSASARPRGRA